MLKQIPAPPKLPKGRMKILKKILAYHRHGDPIKDALLDTGLNQDTLLADLAVYAISAERFRKALASS